MASLCFSLRCLALNKNHLLKLFFLWISKKEDEALSAPQITWNSHLPYPHQPFVAWWMEPNTWFFYLFWFLHLKWNELKSSRWCWHSWERDSSCPLFCWLHLLWAGWDAACPSLGSHLGVLLSILKRRHKAYLSSIYILTCFLHCYGEDFPQEGWRRKDARGWVLSHTA